MEEARKKLICEFVASLPINSFFLSQLRKDEQRYYDSLKSFRENPSSPPSRWLNENEFNELNNAFSYDFLSHQPLQEVQGVSRKKKIQQCNRVECQRKQAITDIDECNQFLEHGRFGIEAKPNEETLLLIFRMPKNGKTFHIKGYIDKSIV
jgi:hypothetical protein